MSRRRAVGAVVAGLVALSACGTGDADEVQGSGRLTDVVEPTADDGVDAAPGGIVDAMPLPTTAVPDGALGWEVTYWATGIHDELVETRGVILAPDGETPEGGHPVLAWAHGASETGVADTCSPTNRGAVEVPYAEELLDRGFVIASTDYEGIGVEGEHPYLVAKSSGRSVLDVVRAARNLTASGAGSETVLMGQTQGGQAVLAAADMAPEYAPDLELLGVVAGAPSAEMRAMMYTASESQPHFGFFVMVAAGYDYAYDDLDVGELLSEAGQERLKEVYRGCVDQVTAAFADVEIAELMPKTLHHFPDWLARFEENEIGEAKIPAPVLTLHGTDDVVILPVATEIAVERLCEGGSTVRAHYQDGAGSLDLFDKTRSTVLNWVDDRLAGKKAPSTC